MSTNSLPLLLHSLESPSAFTPERLMDAVRAERSLANEPVPPLCVLDFDGDSTLDRVVFVSESIENIPAGFRARENAKDVLVEHIEASVHRDRVRLGSKEVNSRAVRRATG